LVKGANHENPILSSLLTENLPLVCQTTRRLPKLWQKNKNHQGQSRLIVSPS